MKHAVITGSTGGIGKEITSLLAAQGWSLILVNRSVESSKQQEAELSRKFPSQEFASHKANLADLGEIRQVIEKINASGTGLQMLYNVAGLLTDKKIMSANGYESHFAVNTIAPYALITGLRPSLAKGSSDGRKSVVVNFSTSAINAVKNLEVSRLTNPESIGGLMGAYAKSKLALDVVTCFLQDELLKEGILIESVDPGATKSPMTSGNKAMPWFLRLLQPLLFKSPQVQAGKIVQAVERAVAESKTGLFISEGRVKKMSPLAQDKGTQSELRSLLESIHQKSISQ